MEEMSMDKEEESLGPFFLEHFDNSEYTMAVPGEGVRHTSFFLSTIVLKEFLSDFSNSLQIDKVTKVGVTHPKLTPPVVQVGPPWMDGLTSFANISSTFPHISSCRLVASDREVGHLNDLPNLRQLEVDIHHHFYQ